MPEASNDIEAFCEQARVSEEDFWWMWRRLKLIKGQKMILISTPRSYKNWFYEHWKRSLEEQDAVKREET